MTIEQSEAARPGIESGPPPVMSARRVSLVGPLIVAMGPLSLSLYTPAMTDIVQAFSSTEAMVIMTMTVYFAGFAFGQLFAGTLSDAFGRKSVALAFIAVFLAGTVLSLSASDIQWLIAGRVLQGLGASSGTAIAYAMVRDLFTGDESLRIMNLISIVLAMGPIFAPSIGGVLLIFFGWRSAFFFMLAFAVLVLVCLIWAMRETATPDPGRFKPRSLVRNYWHLLSDPRFFISVAVTGGAAGAFYVQSTVLPFVLMGRVGLTAGEFGLGMLPVWGGFFVGSLLVRRLIGRVGVAQLILAGLVMISIGATLLFINLVVSPSYLSVMLPITLMTFGNAFVIPPMVNLILAPFPHMAGTASSLMGFVQTGSGFVTSTLAGLFSDAVLALAVMSISLVGVSCISFAVFGRLSKGATGGAQRD